MTKSLLELIKLLMPLGPEKRHMLAIISPHLDSEELQEIAGYLKMDRLFGKIQTYGISLLPDREWVEFKSHVGDERVQELMAYVNKKVKEAIDEEAFEEFAPHATEAIPKLIANNITGLDDAKLAAALLLFAKEPIHTLLLGDPGTGKTEILRSVSALASKSSFGLGSGTSGAGLSAMFKGDELLLGLLPRADEGVACIDELNLMKTHDRAALYSAMEKGFITYDKGGKHEHLSARVRVFATANPKGDKFVGKGAAVLKKQLPFAHALLSRFHLVFLVRKPTPEGLGHIAGAIVRQEKQKLRKGDVAFVKAYADWTHTRDVEFDKKFEQLVVRFIKELAADEKRFLVEIGPRTVVGVIRMSQALARMQGKDVVEQQDLVKAMDLLKQSLYVRKQD